jgi:Bacterial Ig domain/WD40-like Beta Propeller Repeat
MPHTLKRIGVGVVAAAIIAASVAGCGGGGGGGGGTGATNSAPVFGSLAFSTKQGTDLSGQVTATDVGNDTLTFTRVDDPASGSVTSFTATGAFVYHPTSATFTGSDSFHVRVTDTGGNVTNGTVAITVRPNQPPVATADVLRADAAALDSINVRANDTDADGDPLTVTIEEPALVGTASVNTDGTVRIASLPSGFKGLTRFKYRVTDSSGASVVSTAVVFVGVDPFRVMFAGDATSGAPEVYLSDFAAPARAVTTATEGNLRLRGFASSANGATVVYRRESTGGSPVTSDLSFALTASGSPQVHVALPTGVTLAQDTNGNDEFRVSADGQWIAFVGRNGSATGVYVLNVNSPTVVTPVSPVGAVLATKLRFSPDSKNLYFLASTIAGGANKVVFTVTPGAAGAAAQISATPALAGDDVTDYSVASDQSRILLQANRSGQVGLYFVDALHLQTEVQVSQTLGLGETLLESTIGLPPGNGGSARGTRVGYTVQNLLLGFRAYVAEVSATPNPRLVASSARVIGFRPDDAALLFSRAGQVYEAVIDSGTAEQLVGAGGSGWYESTGNVVLLKQFLPSGGNPPSYPALAVTVRGAFGTTQPVGTPVLAAHYINTSGFDRAVVVIGEGATTGTVPSSARLALVNALAPDKLLYLADFTSSLSLTTDTAQVVTN